MLHLSRSLKRTKTYSSFNEIRPTIRNKPSGLVSNWPRVLSKTGPTAHHRISPLTPSTPSTPSSSTQVLAATPTPFWQPQPSPVMPNTDTFNQFLSSPDTVIPFLGQQSPPFHPNAQSYQQFFQPVPTPDLVRTPLHSRTLLTYMFRSSLF